MGVYFIFQPQKALSFKDIGQNLKISTLEISHTHLIKILHVNALLGLKNQWVNFEETPSRHIKRGFTHHYIIKMRAKFKITLA